MSVKASGNLLFVMPRSRFVIAIIATLALALGWKLWNLEWIEQQSDPFFSDTANQNPYLAAQLFLQRLGHKVSDGDNEDALEELPQGRAVIVLASGRAHLSEQQQKVLLDWINNGGHLITLATREWNEKTESIDDTLQRQFDVAAVRTGESAMELVNLLFQNSENENSEEPYPSDTNIEPEPSPLQDQPTGSASTSDKEEDTAVDENENDNEESIVMSDSQCLVQTPLGATDIDWPDGQRLVADIGGKMRMEIGDVEPMLSAADALGLQLVQFRFGQGKVTFLANMALWNNRQINNFDNAHLLALLVDDAESIVILHNFDAVPLTELLSHYFPATMIMMVVLIIMVIHHYQLRWGALISNTVPARRSLLQHISASGRFLWQHQQLAPLIQKLQQQISDQLSRHYFDKHLDKNHNQSVDAEENIRQLVTIAGISREKAQLAMGNAATRTREELLEQIRLLQTIRNSL